MANVDSGSNAGWPQREVGDVVGGIRRMLRALARRFAEGYADTYALEQIREIHDEYLALMDEAVPRLREAGYNDREIGEALGVTSQAVQKRWRRDAT